MDIQRDPRKKRRRLPFALGVLVLVLGGYATMANLAPAAPAVDRSAIAVDIVRRGTISREVRAPGRLVSEHVRFIAALTGGRIEQVHVFPGATVKSETVILRMSNPDIRLEALSAEQQLAAAEAALVTLRTSLETQVLKQEQIVAISRANYNEAKRNVDVSTALAAKNLTAENETAKARDHADQAEAVFQSETKQLGVLRNSVEQHINLQRAQVDRLRAIVRFHQDRLASMDVRAGADGQLQEMNLQPGQWVNAGTMLAKVAQPGRLKAVLNVPETQAKDLAVGQLVTVDTRTGIISCHVTRIDPSAVNDAVAVEAAVDGQLPDGVRPDLNVDGTIQIERLSGILYVGRPAYGRDDSDASVFRIMPGGKTAERVRIRLGKSSVSAVVIREGLAVGDSIIISDMSQWESVDRIRIRR